MKHLLIFLLLIPFIVHAQKDTRIMYRQTFVYNSNYYKAIGGWQEIIVTKGDTIYQYKHGDKALRRKVIIVFGYKDYGVKPITNWLPYTPVINDTVYEYRKELNF